MRVEKELFKDAKRRIENNWIASKYGWTPYDGEIVVGWPVNTIVNGEALHFEANFDIGSAKENSCWNVVSNCMYENIKNEIDFCRKF